VIAVESKEVLKALREHDFREAFKKWQKPVHKRERRPKVRYDQMVAPFPEIMDSSLYCVLSLLALQIPAF
jgi:hypothetical protein